MLVTGASGGVGLAAVQIARARGASVLAGVTSKEKGAVALASGAAHLIDLSAPDLRESLRQQVFALTDGRGVDAVFDPVGGDVFDAALRAVAYAGRMVIIGFAFGRIPEVRSHYVLVPASSEVHGSPARPTRWPISLRCQRSIAYSASGCPRSGMGSRL